MGALRADQPSESLLTNANLEIASLMRLARTISSAIGLPETTKFCDFHPAKLFDFSTRARCIVGFRVLGVRGGGASAGAVGGCDLEQHPYLRQAETAWLERAVSISAEARGNGYMMVTWRLHDGYMTSASRRRHEVTVTLWLHDGYMTVT